MSEKMREILFRGKRCDNDAWVEGAFCMKDSESPFGEMVDRPSIIKYDPPFDGFWFRVYPETVGQFTGLPDKNGKMIFDGDILEYRSDVISLGSGYKTGAVEVSRRVVEWGEYGWIYKEIYNNRWTSSWNNYGRKDHLYKKNVLEFATVIGNIHDNPELLEG